MLFQVATPPHVQPGQDRDFDALRRRLLGDSGSHGKTRAVAVSALSGEGLDRLAALVDELLPLDPLVRVRFRFTAEEAGAKVELK